MRENTCNLRRKTSTQQVTSSWIVVNYWNTTNRLQHKKRHKMLDLQTRYLLTYLPCFFGAYPLLAIYFISKQVLPPYW
jgi:hypothetical protein